MNAETRRIVQGLQAESGKFATGIYGVAEAGVRLIGSGWFDSRGETRRVITARHVISAAESGEEIGFGRGNGMKAARPANEWRLGVDPLDVAIADLSPGILEGSGRHLLPSNRYAPSSENLEDDALIIHGFPGVQTFGLATGLAARSSGQVTGLGTSKSSRFNPDMHFAIRYSFEARTPDGSSAAVPEPRGMSGSAVWRANLPRNRADWTPEMASIVGLAFAWDRESGSILVLRIEALREFLTL